MNIGLNCKVFLKKKLALKLASIGFFSEHKKEFYQKIMNIFNEAAYKNFESEGIINFLILISYEQIYII